jgi:hypothetical protein
MAADAPDSGARLVHRLAVAVLIALALYVVIDAVLGLLPPHYSLISNAESDYGVGPYGWLMDVNFVLRGLLSVALAWALALSLSGRGGAGKIVGLVLVVVWGAASFLLAFFPTSLEGHPLTPSGAVHLILAAIAFTAVAIGESILTGRLRALAGAVVRVRLLTVLNVGAWLYFVLKVLGSAIAKHPVLAHLDGLTERLFLLCVLGWLAAVAAGLMRQPVAASEASPT